MRIEVVHRSVVHEDVDAIMNAANEQLRAGGGVCGAIFAAAGARELQQACDALGGCPTGSARATGGFGLKARWVIHAVGPVWRGGHHGEEALLASAYRATLAVADRIGARSLAALPLSVGIFGYPKRAGIEVALRTLHATPTSVQECRFCCFGADEHALATEVWAAMCP